MQFVGKQEALGQTGAKRERRNGDREAIKRGTYGFVFFSMAEHPFSPNAHEPMTFTTMPG